MINETYSKYLGFKKPNDAIGKMIERNNGGIPIVGVVKDFYAQSLHTPVKPLAFGTAPPMQHYLHIALKPSTGPGDWKHTISEIQMKFKALYPQEDFEFRFFDESIAKFYEKEQQTARLLTWATGLAIIISCLGLLGLAIYTINQRTKEIGIRKVLGASIAQVVNLVSRDFLKLVLLAFFIAAPLAWYGMNKWLQNFAYHDGINGWLFVMAAIMMLAVALVTLAFQTIKAAAANPVESLRSE